MNLTLVFRRKYRWSKHYFSVWSLGNYRKLLTANQFLDSRIFFTIINISFFSLRFDLFSIITKDVNQIRNNVVCVLARLVFLFCCALTMGCCNAFQHIFANWKKSEFYGPYLQTMLFPVTMAKTIKRRSVNFSFSFFYIVRSYWYFIISFVKFFVAILCSIY